ncbi:TauD/TfdA family dioxygenase [Pseudomonas sp. AMR01]|uniref:TauD/TfdA family dioxygenase n=1 Tax=Pseudomonas sp. AMR01 TaxID=3064904 RepID=UPI0035C1A6A0
MEQLKHFQELLGSSQVHCGFLEPKRLPLVITPIDTTLSADSEAFATWYRHNQALFDRMLLEFGCLLFRGFALRDSSDFQAIAHGYPEHAFGYIGGATPRKHITAKVYESTRIPATLRIGLHQEKAYMANFPHKLAFFCRQPSTEGGETVLCDMRAVTRRLPAQLVEHFRAARILYVRNFRAPSTPENQPRNANMREYHRPWDEAFLTDDPQRVEQLCRDTQLDHRWLEDGSLTVSHIGDAVLNHPLTGDAIWFNQLSTQHNNARSMGEQGFAYIQRVFGDKPARPYDVRLGDGTPIPAQEIAPVYDALEAEQVAVAWRSGDMLLIDNIAVAHGRNPFKGERDVQVALFD